MRDDYTLDIHYAQSPDYAERQSDLILDYRENVTNHPKYQDTCAPTSRSSSSPGARTTRASPGPVR